MNHVLNFKKSPIDKKDYIFKAITETFPETVPETLNLIPDLMPIRNQGVQGTCYAQSAACMKEWQEKKDNNLQEYLSPQFLYNLRFNLYDDDLTNDEGMYGRDVMKLLKQYGICSEKMYEYGRIETKQNIPADIFEKANANVIDSYARMYNIDDLKRSLCLNGPALIGFPVYNYNNRMWIQNEGDKFEGGHAMTVVGYNEMGFIIRNSWGETWNQTGYTIYNYSDWGAHWEIWTTVDKKNIQEPEKEPEKEPEQEPDLEPDQQSLCEKIFFKIFG